jgi:hypothetical protein
MPAVRDTAKPTPEGAADMKVLISHRDADGAIEGELLGIPFWGEPRFYGLESLREAPYGVVAEMDVEARIAWSQAVADEVWLKSPHEHARSPEFFFAYQKLLFKNLQRERLPVGTRVFVEATETGNWQLRPQGLEVGRQVGPELRSPAEVAEAEQQRYEKVWYQGHELVTLERGEAPEAAARRAMEILDHYGGENLGPYTDFEWGMLCGELSALRWTFGGEWGDLDS